MHPCLFKLEYRRTTYSLRNGDDVDKAVKLLSFIEVIAVMIYNELDDMVKVDMCIMAIKESE